MMTNEEFVNLPVPTQHYHAMVRLLADLMANSSQERVRGWTADEIAKLKEVLTNRTAILLLDLTADRADQWVDFSELCTHAGRTKREAMGDLAGLTQRIRKHKLGK